MTDNARQLQATMAALQAQRALLGDAVVDAALAALREKLAALTQPEQQLKAVTVLFLDVVGSTRLAEQLDPEDIHAVMDGALERLSAIVVTHRGKVLQYAGDSLLAAFGADGAHEDDAERAVRAGLRRAGPCRLQRARGHQHRASAARRWSRRRGQHPWPECQHRRTHGTKRTAGRAAHQP
jgi:class 3 adenylate cyclase